MNRRSRFSPGGVVLLGVAVIAALVFVVWLLAFLTSYTAPEPGFVGVVQKDGPFDSRALTSVKDAGSGPSFIGPFNHLRQVPVTQRNYIISSRPGYGDRKGADSFCTPTADAQQVCIEGQALFTLNSGHNVVKEFVRRYGQRTFEGRHLYDGDDGWSAFLDVQFRPILENALRQEIGKYQCSELNSACQLVRGTTASTKITTQNVAAVQNAISTTLQTDLNDTLKGNYFNNIRFRLQQITFPKQITDAIDAANAAKAQVSQQTYIAQAATQQALAARRVAQAYRSNPYAGMVQVIRALCEKGTCSPIVNLGGQGLGLNFGSGR